MVSEQTAWGQGVLRNSSMSTVVLQTLKLRAGVGISMHIPTAEISFFIVKSLLQLRITVISHCVIMRGFVFTACHLLFI